jgi:hypothetical protein
MKDEGDNLSTLEQIFISIINCTFLAFSIPW